MQREGLFCGVDVNMSYSICLCLYPLNHHPIIYLSFGSFTSDNGWAFVNSNDSNNNHSYTPYQQQYLVDSAPVMDDGYGKSVCVSGDGNVMAVGAYSADDTE